MNRHRVAALAVFVLCSTSQFLSAQSVFLQGLPSGFLAGEPIEFAVGIPPATNLAAYNVELTLSSTVGQAGVDFFFDESAAAASSTGYVFLDDANFLAAANTVSGSEHRITLTDFFLSGGSLVGRDIQAGINDQVATVVIKTAPGFIGELEIGVDASRLILDQPVVDPTPVVEFSSIVVATDSSTPSTVNIVPEPLAGSLVLGPLLLLGRRRR